MKIFLVFSEIRVCSPVEQREDICLSLCRIATHLNVHQQSIVQTANRPMRGLTEDFLPVLRFSAYTLGSALIVGTWNVQWTQIIFTYLTAFWLFQCTQYIHIILSYVALWENPSRQKCVALQTFTGGGQDRGQNMIIGINDGCIAWPIQLTYVCGSPGYVFCFIFWCAVVQNFCQGQGLYTRGFVDAWYLTCLCST